MVETDTVLNHQGLYPQCYLQPSEINKRGADCLLKGKTQKLNKSKLLLPGGLLALATIALVLAYNMIQTPDIQVDGESTGPVTVLAETGAGIISGEHRLAGTLVFPKRFELTFATPGEVGQILVLSGNQV